MAQAALIIHTGTRLCDFPSTFTVCPSVLGSDEVNQIRKQVLAATRSIDDLNKNEVRYMVYTSGNNIIAGVVSFLKNLADNNAEDEKFFLDAKGRSVYAFVGFVFQTGNISIPVLDKKILWNSFKKYMEPIWERTVLETMASNFNDISFQDTKPSEPTGAESVAGMTLYATGSDSTPIFSYWLGQALKGKVVSFCSNITDFRVVKDKPFSVITTTANIIERMKQEGVSKPISNNIISSKLQITDSTDRSYRSSISEQKKTSSDEKNSKTMWKLIGGVLLIIFLLVLLLK